MVFVEFKKDLEDSLLNLSNQMMGKEEGQDIPEEALVINLSTIESNPSKPWPLLNVISKSHSLFPNGQNRQQFPNPFQDRLVYI